MNQDAQRYARLKALFLQAREQPADQRIAWIVRAAEGDSALASELIGLVAADSAGTETAGYLKNVATLAAQTLPDGAVLAGERQYRLLSKLGSGGMGTVYLAERLEGGFKQQLAIKFSTLGVGNPEVLARFRAERQFLARLSHPNIARLLDGGAGPDGAPFLVMEYVEGERIDDWCAASVLGARARVALFVKVCRAVQVAHQNLIVHRDLKPANILVDKQGEPKLLDFGIAKLLGDGAADFTQAETREGAQLLTPRYASPEQVRGEAVTTAADIYALGVVLYELLTGRSPYGAASVSAPELVRAVCDTEPRRPSSAALFGADPEYATTRFDFAALARELRGDLDAILLKCLRKEPSARYVSAAELADDLERYLDGKPVLAHRGSFGYRARKFVARNKAAVTGAAAFLMLLIASVVALSWQLERTRQERDKSQRITAFLIDLFAQADPSRSSGETITVREALARGNARLAADANLPEDTRATLRSTMGSVLHQIGLYPMAESLLVEAVDYFAARAARGAEHIESVSALAATRLELGQLPIAGELADTALSMAEQRLPPDLPQLGRVAYRTGIVRLRQGRRDEAHVAFLTSRDAWTRAGLANTAEAAEALNGLANWARDSGDPRAAEEYFRQALEIFRATGSNFWAEARGLNNLAVLRLDQSDFDGAERMLHDAMVPMKKALGDEHPLIATALSNLGGVLNRRGKLAEAGQALDESLALRKKLLGEDHPIYAGTLSNRAWNDYSRGDFVLAEDTMRAALAVQTQALGAAHQHTLTTQRNLAAVRFARGDLDEAATLYRQMIAEGSKALGADHPLILVSRQRLALLLALNGAALAQRDELQVVLATQEKKLGSSHIEVAETRLALGATLLLSGARPEGCVALQSAYADWAKQVASSHPDLLLGAALAAYCRQDTPDAAGATNLEQALANLTVRYGEAHPLLTRLPWKS